tara:strand:+ start:54 stop:614 length:561 start_codon:yes stop_codon:yes gene_type:complete
MRIIGGKNKGKKINLPIDKNTRPLRDMVKESIFNLIEHSNRFNINLNNANILDLFSGTGSFGLECLSRNAKKVIFIESYSEAIKVLRKNILSMDNNNSSEIIEKNCFDYFTSKNFCYNKFDIVFLDPPYKEKKINYLIDKIKEKKIMKDGGIIIIHRHKKDDVEITSNFNILVTRNYGISKIMIGN